MKKATCLTMLCSLLLSFVLSLPVSHAAIPIKNKPKTEQAAQVPAGAAAHKISLLTRIRQAAVLKHELKQADAPGTDNTIGLLSLIAGIASIGAMVGTLVSGISAVLLFLWPAFAVAAIVLGIVALRRKQRKYGLPGLIIGITGLTLFVALVALVFAALAAFT